MLNITFKLFVLQLVLYYIPIGYNQSMQYFIFHLHFFLFALDSLYGSVFVLFMTDENKNDLFLARNNDAQLNAYAEM